MSNQQVYETIGRFVEMSEQQKEETYYSRTYEHTVRKYLSLLKKTGIVTSSKPGYYRLTAKGKKLII